ncbi:OLC1v1028316C1 [Oldenlandia corymbosa var. corymbosa]|uniref:endo-polygalacturonase n=1 Tax=Oldenlandia corymbosa var. corymbosa TaxID=529605 RepID=A0AAV1CBP7_OLDCO|nr:OLC1v1028316C1 [Oldenlandia corymbosa var. corymbosa]
MGSEGRKSVIINVTGFKKFHGVAENPTEYIVNNLQNYVQKRGLPAGVKLGSCLVLETAGDGALPMLYQVMESGIPAANSFNGDQVVWLHLGVNSGSLKFAIEQQAVNEATFRCPDEMGWQPQQLAIVPGDGAISQARKTSCLIEEILEYLKKGGYDVMMSNDAGRFVCNFVYYHSLRYAEEKDKVRGDDHETRLSEEAEIIRKLESFDVEIDEDDEVDDVFFEESFWTSSKANKVLVNVDTFGAVGDGVADDTNAFVNAWKQACTTPRAVFLVPQGRRYLVNATRFKGPCDDKLLIQIDGTIVAPDDPKTWDPKNPRNWLGFYNLSRVRFQGSGVIDGSGSKWWAASCKRNKTNPCRGAPTALTIDSSSAVRVKGLTIQNSQQMHFVISRSNSVRVTGVKVTAPEDSPNTDGIHITESTNVVLQNCKIGTGDDCVSIVNGSSNIKMKTIYCGPGHGISIGSLGKDNSVGIVTKVVLDTAFLRGTTNGLRIKTWQGGSGYVQAVRYQNVMVEDVANPIIIDQFYCDSPVSCKNQTSAVQISEIMYQNISGTSKSKEAMKFACSDTVPCSHIVLNNINLEGKDGSAQTYCNSAVGIGYGYIQPSAECLTSSDKGIITKKPEEPEHLVHTEL